MPDRSGNGDQVAAAGAGCCLAVQRLRSDPGRDTEEFPQVIFCVRNRRIRYYDRIARQHLQRAGGTLRLLDSRTKPERRSGGCFRPPFLGV